MDALLIYTVNKLEDLQFSSIPFNIPELESIEFWRAVFAEFLAQVMYVSLGCMSLTKSVGATDLTHIIQVSLAFGLAMMVMFQTINHVSGGHINPAITFAYAVLQKISPQRFVFFVTAQFLGGLCGGLMSKALLPQGSPDSVLTPHLGKGVSLAQGFGVESALTFLLVIIFMGCTDKKRASLGSPGLIIGLTVTLCHLAGFPYTGAGINPSRTVGTAVVTENTENLWIYIIGPFVGGVTAAFFYACFLDPSKVLSVEEAILKMEGESKV